MAASRTSGTSEHSSRLEAPRATLDGQSLNDAIAAAFAFHVAENLSVNGGNKRTALNAALVFLLLNGWARSRPCWRLCDATIAISVHFMNKTRLADSIKEFAVPDAEHEAF